MYGAITGMRFAGSSDPSVLEAIRTIMPRRPAREELCDVCPKSQMPTVKLPGLEARLAEGYRGRGDGDSALPQEFAVRFEGDKGYYNYGFAGKKDKGERLYWMA